MSECGVRLSRVLLGCLGAATLAAGLGFIKPADSDAQDRGSRSDRYMRVVEDPGRTVALQLAARTFAPGDPESVRGPTIALIAMAHIGEKQLYAAVQELLDQHEIVLYESVKPPGAGGAGGADDQQRIQSTKAAMQFIAGVAVAHHAARQLYPHDVDELIRFAAEHDPRMEEWLMTAQVDAWGAKVSYRVEDDGQDFDLVSLGADGRPDGNGINADLHLGGADSIHPAALGLADDNLQAELARALGLEFQLEALDYDRASFRSSDMAMNQLEQAMREQGVDFAPISGSLSGTSFPGRLAVIFLRLIQAADVFFEGAISDALKVVHIELLGDEAVFKYSLDQFGRGFKKVIVNQRNQLVVDQLKAILQREPEVDSIAVLYGAGHMPDMAERLAEQLGYSPGGVQWLTAIEVDLAKSSIPADQLQSIRRMVRQQLKHLVPQVPARPDQ